MMLAGRAALFLALAAPPPQVHDFAPRMSFFFGAHFRCPFE